MPLNFIVPRRAAETGMRLRRKTLKEIKKQIKDKKDKKPKPPKPPKSKGRGRTR